MLTPEQVKQYRSKYNIQQVGEAPIPATDRISALKNGTYGQPQTQSTANSESKPLGSDLFADTPEAAAARKDTQFTLGDVGNVVAGNTMKFGKTVGESLVAPENAKRFSDSLQIHQEVQNNLQKAIDKAKQSGQDTSKLEALLTQHTGNEPKLEQFTGDVINKTPEQIAGEAGGTALEALSGGALSGIGNATKAATTGEKILQGAKIGATYGGIQGATGAMQEDKSAGDVLFGGVKGATAGGALGGVLGGAAAAIGKAPSLVSDATSAITKKLENKNVSKQGDFIEQLITPEMNTKATASAIKTGKVAEGEGLLGKRDVTNAIPGFDNIKASVEQVPGISSKNTALKNVNLIHDAIATTAEDLQSQLKGKGAFTPAEFNDYMTGVKNSLAENPLITGDAEATANKIVKKFNSLIKTNGYDAEGLLKARKQLDSWIATQKGSSIFDPKTDTAVSTALRGIRQGGNDFIASKVPDVAVKDMLAHQTNLYRAIDNIAPKAAKEGTSKLSRATGFIKQNKLLSALIGEKILKYTTGIGY